MAEVFESGDFHPVAHRSGIDVIGNVVAAVEPDQVQIEFVAHRFDQADQVLAFLFGAIDVPLFVNQPSNRRVRAETVT